jgi:hypothetical protein
MYEKGSSLQKEVKTTEQKNLKVDRSKIFGHTCRKKTDMDVNVKVKENMETEQSAGLCPIFKRQTLNKKVKSYLYKSLIRPILLLGVPT